LALMVQELNSIQMIQEVNMNKIIDPKNPHTVGKSAWNLGNHVLIILFVSAIIFVIKASYG
jgi:urease accessory protein UreE